MLREHPSWLGSGVGTFPALSRADPRLREGLQDRHVHNDWLETRLTFGWAGMGLVLAALALTLARAVRACGSDGGLLRVQLLAALTGCLLHARFDFPFQNPVVLLTFLALCAVVWASNPRPRKSRPVVERPD
jgi:O-antigen ligase